MTPSEYEIMMVNRAGGLNTVKAVVQVEQVKPAPAVRGHSFVVQNEDSFRESFMEKLFKRGAVVRMVG